MGMRIHVPFRHPDELAPLIEAGADSFYCGVVHPGNSINDRSNSVYFNLPDMRALEKSIRRIHDAGRSVAVAVNKQTLDIGAALRFIRAADKLGTDELILSSLTLLHAARNLDVRCRLSLSCTNPVFNSEALEFFRRFRVGKICLPRHLSLDDVASLSRSKGEVELEVFIMCGLCVFTEGYCGMHALPYEDQGEPCYCFKVTRVRGAAAGKRQQAEYVESRLASRELDGCGLCALPRLLALGIDSLKIEGRDEPLHDRIAYAKAVRDLLAVLRAGKISHEEYAEIAKKYCSENVAPCNTKSCYY